MITVKNKLESLQLISDLGLNRFPEKLFKKGEEKKVQEFINKYPAKYYAIRDKSAISGGVFNLKVEPKDIFEKIKNYTLYTINVSSANYEENQMLEGEIEILSNNEVYAKLTTGETAHIRDNEDYEFVLKTDIFDDKTLNKIPYFDYLYEYIISHDLKDVVVEFAIFNTEVGIKNEKIIIYELRTDY